MYLQSAGFLSVMELEKKKSKRKAEKSKSDIDELCHTFIKAQAKTLCRGFYVVLPQARTNFLAIQTRETDQNYVFGITKWALPKSSLDNCFSSQNQSKKKDLIGHVKKDLTFIKWPSNVLEIH